MPALHLDLDPAAGRRGGLEEAIRAAIRSGRLQPGVRLPSSRSLAAELGLSRATIVSAYEQLVAEGYLEAHHGSATRVARLVAAPEGAGAPSAPSTTPRADFRPGEPDLTSFPRAAWLSATKAVLHHAPASTFAYGDAAGLVELRTALAAYLGRARAVVASPDRTFVFSGFGDALATLAAVLAQADGRPIAVDEPCLPWHRAAIARAGLEVRPVTVDDEGVRPDAVADTGAGGLLTTPAHQYPTGATLSSRRRAELVEWARDTNSWIIEDDYDGEFRYDRQPVGAVQGLAPDRVVYAGTASKSIAPGVGIGWLVVPAPLVDPLRRMLNSRVTTSTLEQAVLARFLDSGGFDRHLRRIRVIYRRRRAELLRVISASPELSVRGIAAGLHLTAEVDSLAHERLVLERSTSASVALMPLSYHYQSEPRAAGFVFGFTRPPEHAWASALRRLRSVLTQGS